MNVYYILLIIKHKYVGAG